MVQPAEQLKSFDPFEDQQEPVDKKRHLHVVREESAVDDEQDPYTGELLRRAERELDNPQALIAAKRESLRMAMTAGDRKKIETIKEEIARLSDEERKPLASPVGDFEKVAAATQDIRAQREVRAAMTKTIETQPIEKSKSFQLQDLHRQETKLLAEIEDQQRLMVLAATSKRSGNEDIAETMARLTEELKDVQGQIQTMIAERASAQERYAGGQQASREQQTHRQGPVYQQMDYATSEKKSRWARFKDWFGGKR